MPGAYRWGCLFLKRRACRYSANVYTPRLLDGFAGNERRFCHGSWTSGRFSAGVVRCRLRRPGETLAPRGVSGLFCLRNRPEVVGWIRGVQGVGRVSKGMPCAGGLTSANRGTTVRSFPNAPPSLFMYDCNRTSRRHARLMRGSLRAGEGGPLPVDSCR